MTNPLRTQAGDSNPGDYPLNVTIAGGQVNISTGVVNATITSTLFSSNQLSVYQVDTVLLSMDIFVPKAPPAPALAPVPVKPKAKTKPVASPKSSTFTRTPTTTTPTVVVDSGAVLGLTKHGILVSVGFSVFIAAFSL